MDEFDFNFYFERLCKCIKMEVMDLEKEDLFTKKIWRSICYGGKYNVLFFLIRKVLFKMIKIDFYLVGKIGLL